MITIIQGIIERGLIFSLIVACVYLTSRIIKRDDLTIEGSFGIGGAVTAACLTHGVSFLISLPLALAAGGLCGLITGLLHTRLNINHLISGIVVTTGAFSLNLKLCSSNVALGNATTIFTVIPTWLASIMIPTWLAPVVVPTWLTSIKALVVIVPITIGTITLVKKLLSSELGFLLFAVGDNPQMLLNLGKKPENYITAVFTLSNMLSGLAGALFVQYVGYFSIWSNVGVLVVSLAGLILAQIISKQFGYTLVCGALAYQALIAATFELQIDQDWNKLITACLIVALIVITKKIHRGQACSN